MYTKFGSADATKRSYVVVLQLIGPSLRHDCCARLAVEGDGKTSCLVHAIPGAPRFAVSCGSPGYARVGGLTTLGERPGTPQDRESEIAAPRLGSLKPLYLFLYSSSKSPSTSASAAAKAAPSASVSSSGSDSLDASGLALAPSALGFECLASQGC